MIAVEIWQRIRYLYETGQPKSTIADEVGVSVNTVRQALAQEEPPSYHRKGRVSSALEAHREMVEAGLSQRLHGARLLSLVHERGYHGSDSAFYEWLAGVKEERKTPNAACRFETGPGEQAQFDWSPYNVSLGGQRVTAYVFGLVLGYSRRVHWFPSLAEDMDAIFEALVACLTHFGGCCRTLVIDNPKAMVLQHKKKSGPVWNEEFLRLCGHYRIGPIACTPQLPRAKGKVENPFAHLEAWVITAREWPGLQDLESGIAAFESQWEGRIHGTTKERPIDRFEQELGHLIALPTKPFPCLAHEFRQVSNDCLFSMGGVRYSVPWVHANKKVRVRVSRGVNVVAYDLGGCEVARHEKKPPGSPPQICLAHYEGLPGRQRACLATLLSRFRERYGGAGDAAEAFLQQTLAQPSIEPQQAVAQVLELLEGAPAVVAVAAMGDAVALQVCRRDHLAELLRRRLRAPGGRAMPECTRAAPPTAQLVLPELEIERPLAAYSRALPPQKGSGR